MSIGPSRCGFPGLALPRLADLFDVNLLAGALAIAAIVLVQGAGVAESDPIPTARRPR